MQSNTHRFPAKQRLLIRIVLSLPLVLTALGSIAQTQEFAEPGVEVLTRGPIHEAFAEVSITGAKVGVVVPGTPYDPIVELPPDQRPVGNNIDWIPGYWSWDDDRNDFIWVSGVWRDLPPGRQWVPGYWASRQNGSQWISGFWDDVARNDVMYLPAPPQGIDVGPSSPAPGPNSIWTPGCWVWQTTRYDWQPGYWVVQQPDWVWSPAHYTWTPRGYIYVPGYWDYDLVHRGVVFAPVYYPQPIYQRPTYSYSPRIIIDLGLIVASLFIRTDTNHYYFGDYYDRRYEARGMYPWHSRHNSRYGDDPLYVNYRANQLQRRPDWDNHLEEMFRYRRDHVDARPPQTFVLQVNMYNKRRESNSDDFRIGKPLSEINENNAQPMRFTHVDMEERKQSQSRSQRVRSLQVERAQIESARDERDASGVDAQPVNARLSTSPVAARARNTAAGVKVPPNDPGMPTVRTAEPRVRRVTPGGADSTPIQQTPGKLDSNPRRNAATEGVSRRTTPSESKPTKMKSNRSQLPEKAVNQPTAPVERPTNVVPVPPKRKRNLEPRSPSKTPEPPKKERSTTTQRSNPSPQEIAPAAEQRIRRDPSVAPGSSKSSGRNQPVALPQSSGVAATDQQSTNVENAREENARPSARTTENTNRTDKSKELRERGSRKGSRK